MRTVRALSAALIVVALAPSAASAAIVEADRVATSFDDTPIVYNLFLPDGASADAPVPAILTTHGWGGTRASSPPSAFLDAGYAVLSWDQRGFGESGGEVKVDDPDFEARDVSALIDVLAADPRIARETPEDPRVGMSGGSYAGGIQFISAAQDTRIDAIAPEIAWNDLLEALIPEGVVKMGWGLLLYGGGMTSLTNGVLPPEGPAGTQLGAYSPELHRALAEGAATGTFSDASRAFFELKGPDHLLGAITAPTFILQATTDTLFTPRQAIDNFQTIAAESPGVPLKMAWYCGGHGSCAPFEGGPGGYARNMIVRWFDRWVKEDAGVQTGPRFEYLTDDGVWHGAADYPVPGTATRTGSGSGPVVVNGEPVISGILQGGNGSTSLEVEIPPGGGTIVGTPVVRLKVAGAGTSADGLLHATLFLQLVSTTKGHVVGNQVTPKVVEVDGETHTYEFPIDGVAYTLDPGERLALEIAGSALGYELQRGAAVVQLEEVQVDLPMLGG